MLVFIIIKEWVHRSICEKKVSIVWFGLISGTVSPISSLCCRCLHQNQGEDIDLFLRIVLFGLNTHLEGVVLAINKKELRLKDCHLLKKPQSYHQHCCWNSSQVKDLRVTGLRRQYIGHERRVMLLLMMTMIMIIMIMIMMLMLVMRRT